MAAAAVSATNGTRRSCVRRFAITITIVAIATAVIVLAFRPQYEPPRVPAQYQLEQLEVKGRAPITGYSRGQFYKSWITKDTCSTAEDILRRDLVNVVIGEDCRVVSGELHDPYTGMDIEYRPGGVIQIDHVVALGNAWVTGAFAWTPEQRRAYANDSLVLLAVSGKANAAKRDGDAATWLPSNKGFRCSYVGLQIQIKAKYHLWVTVPEKAAMQQVLASC